MNNIINKNYISYLKIHEFQVPSNGIVILEPMQLPPSCLPDNFITETKFIVSE